MDSGAFERQLRQEGFRHIYVWQDAANSFYPDHTHAVDTAHIILEGEMTLTCGGSAKTYAVGERPPDVPAGAVHSARNGAEWLPLSDWREVVPISRRRAAWQPSHTPPSP